MITLAFDTCLDKMYAVLKKDNEILASKIVENKDNKYHSAFLISTLQEILSTNNIKPQDVNLIAVNIGPGSFTGIRACVTVARVMAQQLNCKAIGVSSLEILSKLAENNPLAQLFHVVILRIWHIILYLTPLAVFAFGTSFVHECILKKVGL